jgi:ABC-type multidrug transport system fused ATPase/permease subunit
MDETDVILPNTLKNFMNQVLRILGTLFIVTYTFPSIIFTIIPLAMAVGWVLKTYLVTSRLLRRSASATMAVVNGHMGETISGVATIRTYHIQTQVNKTEIHLCLYPPCGELAYNFHSLSREKKMSKQSKRLFLQFLTCNS